MFNFGRSANNTINVSTEDVHKMIHEKVVALILDVRTPEEYKKGHIPKAVNIPLANLPLRLSELIAYIDKPIVVHCQSGGRSSSAIRILEKHGFKMLYHMNRGFGAWTYEIEK